ncbi:MAG: transporter substrate-binding domain-containing protein [Proteobacteria bacterium]|nr:transporter substrate-binding domain-containing protein [Pseudomonadota bacterium]
MTAVVASIARRACTRVVISLIVLFVVAAPAVAGEPPEAAPGEIVAAIPGHFPPQYVIDENGEISGFAIDVAERVAELAGVRFRYQNEGNWKSAGEAVRSGRADVTVNSGITEERKIIYDYTAPVETFRVSIFVRRDTTSIAGIADLAGTRVATTRTNVAVRLLKDVDDVELVLFDTPLEALFALLSGAVDALVLPEPVVWRIAFDARVGDRIETVGGALKEIKRGMAVLKGNTALLKRLDDAVKAFVGTEAYREIYRKWYGRPEPYWTTARVVAALAIGLLLAAAAAAFWRYRTVVALNRRLRASIAERKQAEERIKRLNDELERRVEERTAELRESERQIRLITDNVPVAILYVDRDRRYRFANKGCEKMFGLPLEKILDRPVRKVLGESAYRKVRDYLGKALAGEAVSFETLMPFRHGGERFIDAAYLPHLENDGTVKGCFVLVNDVTDRKRAEEALRAAQAELVRKERLAALGQLTGTVAHELRNPLGAMRVSIAAIKKLPDDAHPIMKSSVAIVDRSITRCDAIITDLLEYSRGRDLDRSATPIDAWLGELLDEYTPAGGVALRRKLAAKVAVVFDRDRLRRAVLNLLANACQAMLGDGGDEAGATPHVITVGSRVTDARIEVSVSDTGPGIAEENVANIFEPLYSTKSFGVGLGLSIVRQIMEQHGGGVEVSGGRGRGARFTLWLPLDALARSAA